MKISIGLILVVAGISTAASSRAADRKVAAKAQVQDCFVKAEALVKSKFPNASHNADNADTSTNFLFYISKNDCWYDVNISVQDKGGACALGKPKIDESSANCG